MGSRGPIPKAQAERRRRNKPGGGIDQLKAGDVVVPSVDPEWHPVASAWFEALTVSGQAVLYQQSDWATAVLIAESMSRDLNPQVVGVTESGGVVKDKIPLKGASLSAYLKAMSSLLVTEGDRRRMRVELERAEEEGQAPVLVMDQYRDALG